MNDCGGFRRETIELVDCDGLRHKVSVFSGKETTECPDDHPYSLSRKVFRGDTRCMEAFLGQTVYSRGNRYYVEKMTLVSSACRTKIEVCRPFFSGCDTVSMCLHQESPEYGCTAGEPLGTISSGISCLVQLEQASVSFTDARREWDESVRIYMSGSWPPLIEDGYWLCDRSAKEWYRIERLFDSAKCCTMPYVTAKKECPPWSASVV